ncbi:hypothetical protein [Streptomyces hirsutus]|uniref:hypothetical protein n=1 Tax=Streptomyces hirsutus TaxID=35620 RepID=UPI00331D43AA
MSAKLRILAWALGLLALAHPALVPPALDVLGLTFAMALAAVAGVVGWVLANLSLALTAAAGLMLTYAFPGVPGRAARWLVRGWDASIDAVVFTKA